MGNCKLTVKNLKKCGKFKLPKNCQNGKLQIDRQKAKKVREIQITKKCQKVRESTI